ncbi:MAG: hypothetical protein KDA57_06575 [Planctomycetales bacterium]|nr:hypothetical protein [Planctomycetales bacterium]
MSTDLKTARRDQAVGELQSHVHDLNSRQVVDSLSVGMTRLCDLLMVRAHDDVERQYGSDSMVATSLKTIERQAKSARVEIEAYSCIVVEDEVSSSGYVDSAEEWLLNWLFHLRLGSGFQSVVDKRVDFYRSPTIEERRLKFLSVLQRVMPESTKAPLVLFRLFPRSLRIVAAVAFGDLARAQELRAEQARFLPAMVDCHECHGRVLDNFEVCRCCSNPVWKFAWLVSD